MWMQSGLQFRGFRHLSGAYLVHTVTMTLKLWSFIFLTVSLMIWIALGQFFATCFPLISLQFSRETIVLNYFQTLQTRTVGNVENSDTALCRQSFSSICDRLKPKSTSLLRGDLLISGETLPFKSLVGFQKSQHDLGWDGNNLIRQVHTSLESGEYPQLHRLVLQLQLSPHCGPRLSRKLDADFLEVGV